MFIKTIFRVLTPILALGLAACSSAGTPTTAEPAAPPATEAAQLPSVSPSPTVVTAATNTPGCSVVSETFATEPPADSPFPPVSGSDWVQGPANATVTLVEYGDFQ